MILGKPYIRRLAINRDLNRVNEYSRIPTFSSSSFRHQLVFLQLYSTLPRFPLTHDGFAAAWHVLAILSTPPRTITFLLPTLPLLRPHSRSLQRDPQSPHRQ